LNLEPAAEVPEAGYLVHSSAISMLLQHFSEMPMIPHSQNRENPFGQAEMELYKLKWLYEISYSKVRN